MMYLEHRFILVVCRHFIKVLGLVVTVMTMIRMQIPGRIVQVIQTISGMIGMDVVL